MKRLIAKSAAFIITAAMAGGIILPAGIITSPVSVNAEDSERTEGKSGSYSYYKYSDHIEINGYDYTATSAEIPDTIDGLPVTVIGMYAFSGSSLKTVKIPDSVKEIGNYAFNMSPDLESVTIPDSVEKIGIKAFEMCFSLKTVTFPDHLVEMSTHVFEDTPWLEEQLKASPMVIVNGALIEAGGCKGDVVIPSEVKFVSASAFERNDDITSVVFHSGIKTVEDDTFFYCSKLKSVELPGVESIGIMAFDGCTSLKDVKLSGKLKEMKYGAFSDISGSGNITFYGTKEAWENVIKSEDDFIKNATVTFADAPAEPDPSPSPSPSPSPDKTVLGDVDCNGVIDVSDLSVLAISLVDKKEITGQSFKNADVTKDGMLDLTDLATLKQFISKKISEF